MRVSPRDRHGALRQATNDLHCQLDTLARRLDFTRRIDYSRYLLANARPVIGLELALEASRVDAVFEDWHERRRRPSLALDLHALELAPTDVDEPPRRFSTSQVFGVLYVLEGSRLGAQMLLRRVGESPDEAVLNATHFLRSHETHLWPSYLHTLERTAVAIDDDAMIEAARYAFDLFHRSFATHCVALNTATPAATIANSYG